MQSLLNDKEDNRNKRVPTDDAVHDAMSADNAVDDIDARERQLFRSLDLDNDQQVFYDDLLHALRQAGLRVDDRRLRESMTALEDYVRISSANQEKPQSLIPETSFCNAVRSNILLIERALRGHMVIPEFSAFCRDIDRIYQITKKNRAGKPAAYIPQLNLPEPAADQFGVGLCSVDGQRYSVGDARALFSVQSACKPISYCLALEEHGADEVHRYVGHEPSGIGFNELSLNKHSRPHNPMINAGAIMCSALIKLKEKRRKQDQGTLPELDRRGWAGIRFDEVMARWQAACGGEKPRFNNAVYLSERQTADRNFALAYFMREKGAFPYDVDLHDVLDFFFQSCSIELNVEMMSVVAATLANGGVCPTSGERVFHADTVQHCLSLMSSCGMYDFSGEFAFTIGLPAKSSVSGVVMTVVPNVMGLCTWSPRLDEIGNSVRGIEFCRRLVRTFNFHIYDNLSGLSGKKNPRLSRIAQQAVEVNELIWAASKGDLGAIHERVCRGADLNCSDYDLRTPLHLAAAEGRINIVKYFVNQHEQNRVELNPRDRWGGTPLDDAYLHNHRAIAELLEQAGAERGNENLQTISSIAAPATVLQADSGLSNELIWAASLGDLEAVRRLVARGVDLEGADYDLRTPLHLAAAEGHLPVVRYYIAQKIKLSPRDRWGNTPLDDALRHNRDEVARALREAGGQGKTTLATDRQTRPLKT